MQRKNVTVKTSSNQKKFVNSAKVGSKPPKKYVSSVDSLEQERAKKLAKVKKARETEGTLIAREAMGTLAKESRSLISHYDAKTAAAKRKQFSYGFTHPLDFKNTWDFVKGSAMDVLRLAPAALNIGGLLMTTHAPTQAAALAAGRSDLVARYTSPTNAAGIPLQQGGLGNFSNCVGISSMKAINKSGLLYGQRVVGMDKLFDVPVNNALTGGAWAEGDLIATADLNPTGQDWAGTALVQQAKIYNRYKVRKMAFLYATSAAATDEGSIILSVTPDPDSQYTGYGSTGTQLATAVTGADTCAIWASGCTSWYGDKKQNFYARPDGTDARFTSPGILNIVCNASFNFGGSGSAIGSVYVLYDIELTERSLEDSNQFLQFYAKSTSALVASMDNNYPLGTPQVFNAQSNGFLSTVTGLLAAAVNASPELESLLSTAYPGGSLAPQIQYSSVGSRGVFSGFPVGDFFIAVKYGGTGLTAQNFTATNVGNPYYVIVLNNTGITSTGTAAYGILRVLKQTTSAESYFQCACAGTTFTSFEILVTKFGEAQPYQVLPASVSALSQEVATMRKQLEELTLGKPAGQDAVKERQMVEYKFDLGQLVTAREMSESHMKWINQHQERILPSEKGYAFVVWSNQPDKLKVVSVSRILVDNEGTDRARTHNYELAARVFVEYQLWKSQKHQSANLAYGKAAADDFACTAGYGSP